jgi:hypothetical protein
MAEIGTGPKSARTRSGDPVGGGGMLIFVVMYS